VSTDIFLNVGDLEGLRPCMQWKRCCVVKLSRLRLNEEKGKGEKGFEVREIVAFFRTEGGRGGGREKKKKTRREISGAGLATIGDVEDVDNDRDKQENGGGVLPSKEIPVFQVKSTFKELVLVSIDSSMG